MAATKKRRKKRITRFKTGIFESKKTGKNYEYRSSLELKFFEYLESCDDVVTYDYECFRIAYITNLQSGHVRIYIPDFWVKRKNGEFLVEVKAENFLGTKANVAKFAFAKKWCEEHGMKYVVLTENNFDSLN